MLARLEACWRTWPRALAGEARAYLVGRRSRRAAVRLSEPLRYPWLMLPAWLLKSFRSSPSRADQAFLADVLWGQYALFLFVRIHDDLVDQQASSPWLVYVADRYLVESETAFARHLDEGRFWSIFRQCLADTLDGIADVDALQRMRRPRRPQLLRAYARVSSIFKIGSAGVLTRSGRMNLYPRISAFKDEIAIVSQVFDDLTDIAEDLDSGRRNYVAAALLCGAGATAPRRARTAIARRIVVADGLAPVIDEVERHLRFAQKIIAPIRLIEADDYVGNQIRHLDALRDAVHRGRVRQVFGRAR